MNRGNTLMPTYNSLAQHEALCKSKKKSSSRTARQCLRSLMTSTSSSRPLERNDRLLQHNLQAPRANYLLRILPPTPHCRVRGATQSLLHCTSRTRRGPRAASGPQCPARPTVRRPRALIDLRSICAQLSRRCPADTRRRPAQATRVTALARALPLLTSRADRCHGNSFEPLAQRIARGNCSC